MLVKKKTARITKLSRVMSLASNASTKPKL